MKKLGILTLLLVSLAAFVYFYEIVGEEKREEARQLEEELIRIDEDDISGLKVTRLGSSPDISLKRHGEGWLLEEPLETPADKATVDALLRNLTGAKRIRTFENVGESAQEYGLVEPAHRLTVEGLNEVKVLLIGNKDFTGDEIYVQFEGEPQVFLTSAILLNSLDKELLDWRDKRILTFDRDRLQEIRIQRASEEIVLVKKGDDWSLTVPITEPADEGTVSSAISTLETGSAVEFVAEEASDLAEFGLESPTMVVGVREEGQDSWQQLELGAQMEDKVYARNSQRSSIFTVEKDVLKDLFQEVWDFRSKDVVDVDQSEIARLVVDGKASRISVRHEDYKWILDAPDEGEEKEVLAYKFWYPIDDIEFESIQDGISEFPTADVRILLTLEDGSEKSFEFARRGEEYLARQVESGRQGVISKESFEKLNFKVEDITS